MSKIAAAAWALILCLSGPASAREVLRLPWVFSDEPDLTADLNFSGAPKGLTQVELVIGGRFAGFGLPRAAARPPRLQIQAEFTAPGELTNDPRSVQTVLDLGQTLSEYGLSFDRRHFSSGSKLVYKVELKIELAPGDYNVSIDLRDPELEVSSRRTLHLIVPRMDSQQWALSDLKFIAGVGEKLDAMGKAQRVLDPDPWRQTSAQATWPLTVAYSDQGPRPSGTLMRRHWIVRLRDVDPATLWEEAGPAPAKKKGQSWLISPPPAALAALKPGVYVLHTRLWVTQDTAGAIAASKTFEVLP